MPTSTTRSFRVDSEISKILDEEAERMGISVNGLVNMILKRYAEFTRFLSKIDLVVINRELLPVRANQMNLAPPREIRKTAGCSNRFSDSDRPRVRLAAGTPDFAIDIKIPALG